MITTGRGDFNVTSRSALRVLFRNNHVSIWIDPRNDGKAKQCVKVCGTVLLGRGIRGVDGSWILLRGVIKMSTGEDAV